MERKPKSTRRSQLKADETLSPAAEETLSPAPEKTPPPAAEETPWSAADARECWGISGWGDDGFDVDANGHLCALFEEHALDLKQLIDEIRHRGIEPPVRIRLLDILPRRIRKLEGCFAKAIEECNYTGQHQCVFPIKVNQQRHVLERLIHASEERPIGLEVGSKPELLAAVAVHERPGSLIICNGYKDADYVENALLAQQLQHEVIIVIDRPEELEIVLQASTKMGIKPNIGVRAKLSARGAGHWSASTGHRAKFGLSVPEILGVVETLEANSKLDALVLLHFHIGSQINDIVAFKRALREAARLYASLRQRGVGIEYLDVGGGLGVDYLGTRSRSSASSMNYGVQEYANDVVYWVGEACAQANVKAPTLVTETGRALVAHHSMLVFNMLGSHERYHGKVTLEEVGPAPQRVIDQLFKLYTSIEPNNALEYYNDLLHLRNDYTNLFNAGLLDVEARALAENIFWAACWAIQEQRDDELDDREEWEQLGEELADVYYGNFSLFQSLPDAWAVGQVFPVVPLHRLLEPPTRRAVIADLTCDSDGCITSYVGAAGEESTIRLHALDGSEYLIGVFLVGAYQESLGDLHNLFGDTHTVHVSVTASGYQIDEVVEGETVAEVLRQMQFSPDQLMAKVRRKVDQAVAAGRFSLEESRAIIGMFAKGLRSYTYLDRESLRS